MTLASKVGIQPPWFKPAVQIKVTRVFDNLYRCVNSLTELSTIIEKGGAGSSKSHSVVQLLILLLSEHKGLRVGIGRKTFPAHRTSAMWLFLKLLKEYGLYSEKDHHKSDYTYEMNGNYVLFFSLGEGESGREKIKSSDFNIIWLEEATEFDWEDYLQLKLRLRNPGSGSLRNFMVLSFNPIDEQHWIKTQLIDGDDTSVVVHHSDYKDNPFLPKEYIADLLKLINQNANFYRIYTLGEWGKLENLIFTNWEVADALPDPKDIQAWGYGLDFGYTSPAALVKCVISKNGVWWQEMIYEVGLTNAQLIERMSHLERADIYADAARPDQIQEILMAGHNIYPANKEVKTGLDVCKRQKIKITQDSANILREIKGYSYRVDSDGHVWEEPVKFNDHGMDAARYGILGLVEKYGYATIGRRAFGKARGY